MVSSAFEALGRHSSIPRFMQQLPIEAMTGVVNTILTTDKELEINPPCWESALFFLDTFTYMESEFGVVDLVTTGMFDLSHPETAAELDLKKSLRAIRHKSSIAKDIVKWIAENKHSLDDYPQHLHRD